MVIPPPAASPKSEPPNRQKMQQAASAALYIGLVLLALWIIRDFLPAVGWACVIAIALWPLLRKIEDAGGVAGCNRRRPGNP
jgi:predicted PurR-regulated permease PerM